MSNTSGNVRIPNVLKNRKFKVRTIIQGIRENGLALLRGEWLQADYEGRVTGGCILGVTAFNLQVIATRDEDFNDPNNRFADSDDVNEFNKPEIISLYDALNCLQVDRDSKWANDNLGHQGPPNGLGAGHVIVHWNDASETSNGKWVLKTYDEVAAMAEEVLRPFMDQEIEITVVDGWQPPNLATLVIPVTPPTPTFA